MNQFSLALLGTFQAAAGTTLITEFHSAKVRALLAYLAVESDRTHERDLLAGMLWTDELHEQALKNLRQTLHRLGQALEPATGTVALIIADRQSVRLNPAAIQLDVTTFTVLIAATASHRHRRMATCRTCIAALQQATELYRGPFLAGFRGASSLPFDEWVGVWRERLAKQLIFALDQIAEYHLRRGDFTQASLALQRWLEIEPWHGEAHCRQMEVLARSGQRSAALAQFARCRTVLAAELNVVPAAATMALFRRIQAGALDPTAADSVARVAPLPAYATRFVGRTTELEQIAQLLDDPDCRLLTLTGPGGSGKTRLVVEAATAAQSCFADGVRFVALATVPTSERLAPELAQALGLAEDGVRTPEQQLCGYLQDKDMLLVLDNCEHLMAGVGLLARLLEAAPGLTMLTTSREPLHLAAEWLLPLDGLAAPPPDWRGAANEYPAVQLFTQLARQVRPNFAPTTEELRDIAQICRTVAGQPLAVALAAAQVLRRSPAAVAAVLQDDIDALTSPMRDYPERHRSLRAVFSSSWELLTSAEQHLLACCSVFQGSFTHEAAQVIGRAAQDARRVHPAGFGLLHALVDKSLVQETAARYQLHDLVRRYATEYLAAGASELEPAATVWARHSAYYLTLLASHVDLATNATMRAAVDTLAIDLPNIRVAWQHAVEHSDLRGLATARSGLADFYQISSLYDEGAAMFAAAITCVRAVHAAATDQASQQLLCGLLIAQARMLYACGQYAQLVAAAEEARSVAQALHMAELEAAAMVELGRARWRQGEAGAAQALLQQALDHTASASAPAALRVRSEAFYYLGLLVWNQGAFALARQYYEQALSVAHACGYRYGEGDALNNLALVALTQGDYAEAGDYSTRSLAIYRAIGHLGGEGIGLISLGLTCMYQGNYPAGQRAFEACRQVNARTGDRQNTGMAMIMQGMFLTYLGDYATAHTLLTEGLAISDALGHAWGSSVDLTYRGLLEHLGGDQLAALVTCRAAVEWSERTRDPMLLAYALIHLGHVLVACNEAPAAVELYQRAIQIRQALGQQHLLPSPVAGLARCALEHGDLNDALAFVEELLTTMAATALTGSEEPARIALTCYHILSAANDQRAAVVLARAHRHMQERAACLDEGEPRQLSFLERIAAHRS